MKDALAFMSVALVLGGLSLILIGYNAFRQWVETLSIGVRDTVSTIRDCLRDHRGLPSPPQTPTHADPRGLAKQLFRAALRDFMVNLERYGVREVFLEWIRADRPIDGTCDVYLVTPSGVIIAFGTYTGDERDGWIEVHYCPDEQGNTRWPTPQPQPTKESR